MDETESKVGSDSALRIMLVDDHPLFLQSLAALLAARGYHVVGTASSGFEALSLARTANPDLILMDIDMPVCDGLTATRLVKAEMPEVRIVMLTISASDEHLFEAVKSGACGYLLKSQSAEQFLSLVAQVESGGAALPPELAARLLSEFARQARGAGEPEQDHTSQLSDRQAEVLTLVARGMTYAEIAALLHIGESTVRYHMVQIMNRLHLANRSQVIAYAASHGYVPPG